jgi:anti-sigma-K factor RskA
MRLVGGNVMNLVRGDLPDRLAAEYVLGTLSGGARRRFDALLPAHPALRRAVSGWESRLLPMALRAEPVVPPAALWTRLESRLGWLDQAAPVPAPVRGAAPAAATQPRRALRFWRAFSGLATLAAIVLATMLRLAPSQAPMVVVLRATQGSETIVAGLSPNRRDLSIQPLQPVALKPENSLELWALPKSGPPSSLGLVSAQGVTALSKRTLPADTKSLAVSLEPAGGSPTGAPTGPVLFVGDLTL